MINVQDEYRGLLSGVLHGGAQKEDRTKTGTRSVFGRMLRHDMEEVPYHPHHWDSISLP